MSIRSNPVLGIAVLFATGVVVYVVLALTMPIPGLFPDEFLYQHLAQSVAAGDGFSWHGAGQSLPSALYVYFLVPAWLASSGVDAYHLAKAMSAVVACLTVVPVWLLARTMLPPRLALVAPVLCLAGTWMLAAAFLETENLALPFATAALTATVAAMRRPGSRLPWVALGFALLAAWSRTQAVVLVAVIFLAFAADVACCGRGWRERFRVYRPIAIAGAVLLAAGILVLVVKGDSAAGLYSPVLHFRPGLGLVLRKTGLELIDLTTQAAYFPVLLAAALLVNRRAWRDDAVRPLLIVFWLAALAFALESGAFLAGVKVVPWGIDRYIVYAVPLALLLTVVALARPGIVGVKTLAGCGLLSVTLLLTPAIKDVSEERSVGATVTRVHNLISGASAGVSVLIAAVVTCALIAGALRLGRRRPELAPLGVALVLLLVLAMQSQSAWSRTLGFQRGYRTFFPHDLSWVDHHSEQAVATLAASANQLGYEQTEFFNSRITRYYAAPGAAPGRPVLGVKCSWQIAARGFVTFSDGCGKTPSRFLVNDPTAFVTFHDESDVATDPKGGRLVTIAGRPRVQSIVYMPCGPRRIAFTRPWGDRLPADRPEACVQGLRAYLWADARSTLIVTFKGGDAEHTVQIGQQQVRVAPSRNSSVRVGVNPNGALIQVVFDWASRGSGEPEVVGVRLAHAGQSRSLI